MKKKIILLCFGIILISGCGKKEEKYQEILKEYAKIYYEKYMSNIDNLNQVEITIEMLKKANKYGDNYDLSALVKCQEDTLIVLNLDNDKKITSYDFNLKCN